uniref:Berberine demethylenase n=1 Tax=Burkholderia sp. CJ1 TaxID=1940305 RepID=A0A1Q2TD54_9BURK|nr:berberine demethylenase [Burkholderia sp. CJ1]
MENSHQKLDFSVKSLRRPLKSHFTDSWGPPQFTNWVDESMSWKETCYLGDWTFLDALKYTGPDVLKLFADTSVNTMQNFEIGQSKHVIHCNEDGKIIEEGILSRFGENEYVAFSMYWADHVRRQGNYDVNPPELLPLTKFHLQGPNALFVLEKVANESLRDLKFMRFRKIQIAGHEVIALRQGMSGEIGFELQGPLEHREEIWNAIFEAGQEFGIRQMGGRVAMINHLEANYPTNALDYLPAIFDENNSAYLGEMFTNYKELFDYYFRVAGSYDSSSVADWYRSPVELGWGNRIKFDHDFIGAEALRKELAEPRRRIATLVWNSEDVVDLYASFFRKGEPLPDFMELPRDPRGYVYADKVMKDGKLVGMTTSRGYSAYFREMISLCVIDLDQHAPGTQVTVIWGNPGTPQREIRATVAPAPYKTDRGRVDFATLPSYR